MNFENLFFTILLGHILYMEYPFEHLYDKTYKAQLPSKNSRIEAVFHLNNRLNVTLNLKGKFSLKTHFQESYARFSP